MRKPTSTLLLTAIISGICFHSARSQDAEDLIVGKRLSSEFAFITNGQESDKIRSALSVERVELAFFGPGDGFGKKDKEFSIRLELDGSAEFVGIAGTDRIGQFSGRVALSDYGKLCLLFESVNLTTDGVEFGSDVLGFHPHVSTLTLRTTDGRKLQYRNTKGFEDMRFWVIESAIIRVMGDLEWTEIGK